MPDPTDDLFTVGGADGKPIVIFDLLKQDAGMRWNHVEKGKSNAGRILRRAKNRVRFVHSKDRAQYSVDCVDRALFYYVQSLLTHGVEPALPRPEFSADALKVEQARLCKERLYVSHFARCPDAARFRRSKP